MGTSGETQKSAFFSRSCRPGSFQRGSCGAALLSRLTGGGVLTQGCVSRAGSAGGAYGLEAAEGVSAWTVRLVWQHNARRGPNPGLREEGRTRT